MLTLFTRTKYMRNAIIQKLLDNRYTEFADYFEHTEVFSMLVSYYWGLFAEKGILLVVPSSDDAPFVPLWDGFRGRFAKPETVDHITGLIFSQLVMGYLETQLEADKYLDLKHYTTLRAAATGMVFEYNMASGAGLSQDALLKYVDDTLLKVHDHMRGNTTMGANYSDFQCTAVPKLVELANALRYKDALGAALVKDKE